jgi:hypothetical protein
MEGLRAVRLLQTDTGTEILGRIFTNGHFACFVSLFAIGMGVIIRAREQFVNVASIQACMRI